MSTTRNNVITLESWPKFGARAFVAPVYTPFTAGDAAAVAYERIPSLAAYIASQGFNAVFVCGTNGESFSCTYEERKKILEAWMATPECTGGGGGKRRGALRVIAHISCLSFPESLALAEHAAGLGVDAIAYMPPCFFKPVGDQAVADLLAAVARRVPSTGVFFYHFPAMAGVACNVASVLKLARGASGSCPNVVGAKFTHSELGDLQAAADEGFDVIIGNGDELLISALVVGSSGGFSVPGMLGAGRPLLDVMDAHAAGDLGGAARAQAKAAAQMRLLTQHPAGFLSSGKALASRMTGIDLGPPRPPLSPLDPSAVAALEGRFRELLSSGAEWKINPAPSRTWT